ncbi:VOC family protein [Ancylobacter sonchi]|uniref:VOC family protein n=1 Tax=Ancylobacter sonchi TaxID=1937790 RepID=UPI001BD6D147|nr:VOC family protein [Ancylobacter sonchi]MBS7534268.1 VOC family protein [Ancylobacter sonchi]
MKLDHFAWATPDLDAAVADIEALGGVRAAAGGAHPGKGTRNALLDIGNGAYLAIDGPDPQQPLVDNNGARLQALDHRVLMLFAVQTDDLELATKVLAEEGLDTGKAIGARATPSGEHLEWEFIEVPAGHDLGAALPIIKKWRTAKHPSADAPSGCVLADFKVLHPDPERVRGLYQRLGLDIPVVQADMISLVAVFEGNNGRFELPGGL